MAALPPPSMPTADAIYANYEAAQRSNYRAHLGASIIGTECERSLWLTFRWATRVRHAGRMLRLFDTGQREEERLIADLRQADVTVLDVDPDTGKQWQCRDGTGHFGGSADGVAIGLREAPKTWHLCEFKTHNSKSFEKLKKEGVEKSKPTHFAQMQTYMHLMQLTRAFYLAKNKDNDELYSERIHYDQAIGIRLVEKASRVINSTTPPAKISDDPSWYICRFCDHHAQCHGDSVPERHCRSCMHSTPVVGGPDAGEWHCARHGHILGHDEQRVGCPDHRFIPKLVHGEQTDMDGDAVIYVIRGQQWRDEGMYRDT